MPREVNQCVLCHSVSESFESYATVRGWTYVRCSVCGLVFLHPIPSSEELEVFYNGAYRYNRKRYQKTIRGQMIWLDMIEKLCGRTGNMLEVGCSYGYFLMTAASRGWRVQGVELGDSGVQYASSKPHLPVQKGRIQDVEPEQPFDVVVAWHVLEHDPDPHGFIETGSRLLTPGGILALRVPNLGSAVSRLAGRCWQWLSPPEHIYMYTANTLSRLLSDHQLKVEAVVSVRGNARNMWFEIMRARLKDVIQNGTSSNGRGAQSGSYAPVPEYYDRWWYRLAESCIAVGTAPVDAIVSRRLSAVLREAEIAVFARKLS